nr:glycosidase [Microlunatus panaciterrae]
MRPEPGEPLEVEGVLNPAAAWGPDERLYIFPRLVAEGNVSRVGKGEIIIEDGVPDRVERQGVVLAPDRGWEHGTDHGGVEDPRMTWIPELQSYVMTYVAFGPLGPHPALAVSTDLVEWKRLGPVQFGYADELDTDLNLFPNKDVVWFPEAVPGPDGVPCFALLHRPMWELDFLREGEQAPLPAGTVDDRAAIWISYVRAEDAKADISALCRPFGHQFVAGSQYDWESLKIGGGPPPIRIPEGWLLLHHGVSGSIDGDGFQPENQKNVNYAAGAMILDADHPERVVARTVEPMMRPETAEETTGQVSNVVFPTAIVEIEKVLYVLYGMADSQIGVARLDRVDQTSGRETAG